MPAVARGQTGVRNSEKPESSPHLQGTVEICRMHIHSEADKLPGDEYKYIYICMYFPGSRPVKKLLAHRKAMEFPHKTLISRSSVLRWEASTPKENCLP